MLIIEILGKGETKGVDNTSLTVEAKYSINFTQSNRKFISNLHNVNARSIKQIKSCRFLNISIQNSKIRNKVISIMLR